MFFHFMNTSNDNHLTADENFKCLTDLWTDPLTWWKLMIPKNSNKMFNKKSSCLSANFLEAYADQEFYLAHLSAICAEQSGTRKLQYSKTQRWRACTFKIEHFPRWVKPVYVRDRILNITLLQNGPSRVYFVNSS